MDALLSEPTQLRLDVRLPTAEPIQGSDDQRVSGPEDGVLQGHVAGPVQILAALLIGDDGALIGAQNSERLQLPCKILIPAADSGVVVSAGVAHGKPPFLQVTKKAALRLLS